MAQFHYKARDKTTRKLVSGVIEASNQNQAAKQLRSKGLMILSVDIDRSLRFTIPFINQVSTKDRVIFARQLAVMMRAGLPILQALRAIEEQTQSKTFKQVLNQLSQDIEGGTSLSDAFGRHPTVFPPVFVSVARIGEKSGKLEDVLERLASQLEKDAELVSKIRGAMIYPGFILTALVAVVILIMVYIIPQLKGLFDDVDMALPLITQALLALSGFLQRYIAVILLAVIAIIVGLRISAQRSLAVRLFFERIRLKIPIFGKLYHQMMMARFSHTLATLLGAGLPMLEALKTTSGVLDSPNYNLSIETIAKNVQNGRSLSQSLLNEKRFSPMVGHMVAIGEKSGNIDEILTTVGNFFDRDVENLTRNLSSLLEPFLMLLMGLGVGLVVASVIVPIYNLVNAV